MFLFYFFLSTLNLLQSMSVIMVESTIVYHECFSPYFIVLHIIDLHYVAMEHNNAFVSIFIFLVSAYPHPSVSHLLFEELNHLIIFPLWESCCLNENVCCFSCYKVIVNSYVQQVNNQFYFIIWLHQRKVLTTFRVSSIFLDV